MGASIASLLPNTNRVALNNTLTHLLTGMLDRKAPTCLELKLGAQVVLTLNRPALNLVNGSRGVVVDFQSTCLADGGPNGSFGVPGGTYVCPVVRFDNGVNSAVVPSSFFQGGSGGAAVRIQVRSGGMEWWNGGGMEGMGVESAAVV